MKKLIQLYSTPSVDRSILAQALQANKVTEKKSSFLIQAFLGMVLLIFTQQLIQLNISYIDVVI